MMGISSSSESEDDDHEVDPLAFDSSSWDSSSDASSDLSNTSAVPTKEELEPVTSRSAEGKINMDTVTDLRVLFNDSVLKTLGSVSTKDDAGANILSHHKSKLLSWLSDLNMPSPESLISQEAFCDVLASRGVNREDALEVFSRFDTEGVGKAEFEVIQEGIKRPFEDQEHGEISYRTRILQGCPSLPGFVDVFSKTDTSSKHATKLLHLLVSRCSCDVRLLFWSYVFSFS
ncbi:hypothetical protein EB796_011995 [Bugula neritina]|uniref:Uncharacterized protein n=1 Tax=Bugula neritina TaxID=10212 RepID=A0A7J7JVB4_BUGNE|nr:hypothetical protein EB796_011995 [Bugula neritina]